MEKITRDAIAHNSRVARELQEKISAQAAKDWQEFVSRHGSGAVAYEMASEHDNACICRLCMIRAEANSVGLETEEAIREVCPKLPDWMAGAISRAAARNHAAHLEA